MEIEGWFNSKAQYLIGIASFLLLIATNNGIKK